MTDSRQYSCLTLLLQRHPPQLIIESFEREYGAGIPRCQEKFYELLQDSIQYSPPQRWLRALTKSVVDLIEYSGESCIDELVEMAIESSVSSPPVEASNEIPMEAEHAIYQLESKRVKIRKMRVHNEVGTKLWTAGMFLSELCVQNPTLFSGCSVLELGAGVGITGLSLAANKVPPKRVIMTDYSRDTMNNMQHNVAINNDIIDDASVSLSAKELDWAQCVDMQVVQASLNFDPKLIDVILAADCIYSPDLCYQLAGAIENLLIAGCANCPDRLAARRVLDKYNEPPPGVVSGYPFALVVSTLRNPETFAIFLKAMEDSTLICTDVSSWANKATTFGEYFIPIFESHTDVVFVHCLQYVP